MELDKFHGKLTKWVLLLLEYDFKVVYRGDTTNLDENEFSRNPSSLDEESIGPGSTGIVIKRRFSVSTQLPISFCFLALLLRFQYMAQIMRPIDLKLLQIYGRIFAYCISFSKGRIPCLFR